MGRLSLIAPNRQPPLISVSLISRSTNAAWQRTANEIIGDDPVAVLGRLRDATLAAVEAGDVVAQAALSANALAFMAIDWSRFTDWRECVSRLLSSEALLTPHDREDVALSLALAAGDVACGLLRGDDLELLTPLGTRLESLMDQPVDAIQLVLAAGSLLPWLQMSKNPAAAQSLHARMEALDVPWMAAVGSAGEPCGVEYLRGAWLAKWAHHVHFHDAAALPAVLQRFDEFLQLTPNSNLSFRRKRLTTDKCLLEKDTEGTERALRELLNTLHAKRPMERVIYNHMVAVFACGQNDPDRAALHVEHMTRDLDAADCPPSLALMYLMVESRVCLARRDYAMAATVLERHKLHAHTTHVALIHGYAELARALHVYQQDSDARQPLREHLQTGLTAMRAGAGKLFFIAVPEARAALCALALREDIESAFIQAALKAAPVSPPVWADEYWPRAMSVRCFGGYRAEGLVEDGRGSAKTTKASKASNRPLSLLKLIVAHGRQGVTVAYAADALWPAQDGDQAENSLSVNLLRLRKMHSSADLIERRDGWLHLDATQVWTDVAALESHLEIDARTLSEAARMDYIKRLFDLYRGDCLVGIEDEWAHNRAAHYRGRVTLAIQQLLQGALETNYVGAAELLMTQAHARGLDVARLLNAVHPGQRTTSTWTRLQRHLSLVGVH